MATSRKKFIKKKIIPKGIPIPAGTEQETGFTRGETEKINGPVILRREEKKKNKNTSKTKS
jgi:hypothetical protein